jgi:AcrR family transcriptional regulator
MTRQRKPHADSKRNDILKAAIRCFSRYGIGGTSVRDIAREANVSEAALYKHFSGKEAVALAVFMQYADVYTRFIDEIASGEGTFPERLERLVDGIIRLHEEDGFGLLLLSQRVDLFVDLPSGYRLPVDALKDMVRQAIRDGELQEQNAQLTAMLCIGGITRTVVAIDEGILPFQLRDLEADLKRQFRWIFGLI